MKRFFNRTWETKKRKIISKSCLIAGLMATEEMILDGSVVFDVLKWKNPGLNSFALCSALYEKVHSVHLSALGARTVHLVC